MWISRCTTCPRPATKVITGRVPRKNCYSALTCDGCAPKHRQKAYETGGPITEEPLPGRAQDALF